MVDTQGGWYRGGGDLEGRIRSGGGVVTAQRWV